MASLEVLEAQQAGPLTGQQRVRPALEALAASREEQEERHQALEAWGASQGVLEVHQWVALAALAVGREA